MKKPNKSRGRRSGNDGVGHDPSDLFYAPVHPSPNRHLMLLTGQSRIGKTHLLHQWHRIADERMYLIDPKFMQNREFSMRAGIEIEMLVIDHADWLKDAPEFVSQASAWCLKHDVLLLLVAERESWLLSKGVAIPEDVIYLTLNGKGGEAGITLTHMGKDLKVSREDLEREIATAAQAGEEDTEEPVAELGEEAHQD